MKVELYYFDGCPSYKKAAENLRDALKELNLEENIDMIEIVNSEDAVTKKFLGSPTIRINGIDLENRDGDYVFGCRLYSIDGKITVTPTKDYILSKLKSLIKS